MVRLILVCVIFASGIGGAYWFSKNSGELSFVFLDYTVETTVTEFFIYFSLGLVLLQIVLFWIYKIFTIPLQIKQRMKDKRKDKVISNIAGFFSDYTGMNLKGLESKYSLIKDNVDVVDQVSMSLLLEEVSKNTPEIKNKLMILTKYPKTKVAAFQKLIEISISEKDWFIVANYCSELWKSFKSSLLARQYVASYIKAKRWRELEEILNVSSVITSFLLKDINYYLGKKNVDVVRAICKYKIAEEMIEFGDVSGAKKNAQQAAKNLDGFLPATLVAIKTSKDDDNSIVIKLIRNQWKILPHHKLSQIVFDLSKQVLDQKLYKIVKNIASTNSEHYESSIILARASLDSDNFELASKHISDALSGTRKLRACLLMAEFCQRTHANKAEITDWLRQALTSEDDKQKTDFYWDFEKSMWSNACGPHSIYVDTV